MWKFLANKILRNRIAFIVVLLLLTVFMAYKALNIKLSYEFVRVLPTTDPAYVEYENFKQKFGEDGSVMVIGFADSTIFQIEKFNSWFLLSDKIRKMDGIQNVLSIGDLYDVVRNDSLHKFDFVPLVKTLPQRQSEIDSIKNRISELPFYDGLILNRETHATVMAITFHKKDLDSKHRIDIVNEIKKEADAFGRLHNIELHFSGMPYIRTAVMEKVSHELKLFLILAVLITAFILWIFFRTISSVVFSILVVAIGVVWSMGSIELFNFKITILTALIPPLIMVIGVPNCIFLINKYHSEYARHGNRIKALARMISTVGISLFLANITTAIGFGVLVFTNSSFLTQFGAIAAINVMVTYFITLIFIPIILSFLPPPSVRQMRHLEGKRMRKILEWVDFIVHHKRNQIYTVIVTVTLLAIYGMTKIDVTGYVVDDLPKKNPVYTDMHFFEKNFKGVLPFEIFVDTKKPNGVFDNNGRVLYKMKALQKQLEKYPELSKALSITEALKFSYQAYRGGDPKYYVLPGISELKNLNDYTSTVKGNENRLKSFIDSSRQYTRISMQMADVGSKKIKTLLADIQPKVDSIFDSSQYQVKLTGHSLMFLKGNDYLLYNLYESLIIEIILIAIVGMALFRSIGIILLSKLPCLIPLVITAGIMGFLDIRFKPSTILIFSIAFGISSDGTIYFLSKYRQELKQHKKSIGEAISATIMDTGFSMIYTAVILFFGFGIFAASDFGGTAALGLLISITLLVAMITNLILLPSLLLSIDKWVSRKEIVSEPLIELYDNEEE
ncbi:MAG: MMPL family transporter [Bacteroidia bacterium]|nr:MMPL family transporter [Bacteroidia bacterium]QQR95020.1 MAG: MMPL family transporter [Bacteroidota bacterium]MBP7714390.1 MMPL family transporter [Bacteroidia bacterium]MBP8669667.1 MMPL family transporter [Bacteroidia bacterium]HOZ89533.1 MMPL family transporter [Bacteroidia bacterium]